MVQFASLLEPAHIQDLVESMNVLSKLPRNRLLLALPSRDLRKLMSHLEHVPYRREQILVEADKPLDHVFFPDSGVVSVMAVYSDGGTIEMATIGREGCAGVQAVFGTSKSSARYWVQIPGSATKISRAAFTRAVQQMPSKREGFDQARSAGGHNPQRPGLMKASCECYQLLRTRFASHLPKTYA
jgi:CRP-like cAMP-binding protein